MLPYVAHQTSACYDKLNRLPWKEGLVIAPFGTRLGIRVTDKAIMDEVRSVIPNGWNVNPTSMGVSKDGSSLFQDDESERGEPCDIMLSVKYGGPGSRPGTKNYHLVYAGHTLLTRTLDWAQALTDLRKYVIENIAMSTESVAVFPGVLLVHQGRGLLFLGPEPPTRYYQSFLDAGAILAWGGLVALDPRAQVRAFPSLETTEMPLENFTVNAAFVCRSVKKRKKPQVTPASSGEGVMALFGFALSAAAKPDVILKLVSAAAKHIDVFHIDDTVAFADPAKEMARAYRQWSPRQALTV
jgi:hypothetical protein